MRTKEVLRRVPGLSVFDLLYWAKKGYIEPKTIRIGKRLVRDYPKDQVRKIKLMYYYITEKGFKPLGANIQAEEHLKFSSLYYKAPPLPFTDKTVSAETENRAQREHNRVLNNRSVRLLIEILTDSSISQRQRHKIQEQVTSFLTWLRDRIKSK